MFPVQEHCAVGEGGGFGSGGVQGYRGWMG